MASEGILWKRVGQRLILPENLFLLHKKNKLTVEKINGWSINNLFYTMGNEAIGLMTWFVKEWTQKEVDLLRAHESKIIRKVLRSHLLRSKAHIPTLHPFYFQERIFTSLSITLFSMWSGRGEWKRWNRFLSFRKGAQYCKDTMV